MSIFGLCFIPLHVLAIQALWHFQGNSRIALNFYTKGHWNFDQNYFKYLGSITSFTILNLPFHKHHVFFHSFNFGCHQQGLRFSMNKTFTSLVKFVARNFMFLDTFVNGIILLVFFVVCPLLVCKNTTGFYV